MDTALKAEKIMKDKILEAIPEINLIEDADLREKTLQVWEDAIAEGGWTFEAIEKMPFSVHVENCNITFFEHVRTVCKMCIAVNDVLKESYGERTKLNKDFLIAGALLADVGKLIEYEERDGKITKAGRGQHLRHPFIGVAMAHKCGIPPEVQHIIATHSKEGELMTRSNESVIFHHADFIDFDLVSKKRPF
jgi:putative nucleotidyltransferase with HDIG domain